jgi:Protein of unknown function (DUF4233)
MRQRDMSEGEMGGGEMGEGPDQPRSGLRNPGAAVRGVGAATLAAEGLVLLLAIIPLRVLGATGTGGTFTLLGLAVVSFSLAGLLRRGWAWIGGSVLQVVALGLGFVLHGSLVVLGVLFGLVWLYVLRVRKTVLGNVGR